MRKCILPVICLLISMVTGGQAQNKKEPVKVTDLLRIKSISAVTISNLSVEWADRFTVAAAVREVPPKAARCRKADCRSGVRFEPILPGTPR